MQQQLETIKSRAKFKEITDKGQKEVKRCFVLFVSRNETFAVQNTNKKNIKIGFIVTSKVGCAVERNRIKRRLRSLLNTTLSELPYDNYSICVLAKRQAYFVDFKKMRKHLVEAIEVIFSRT